MLVGRVVVRCGVRNARCAVRGLVYGKNEERKEKKIRHVVPVKEIGHERKVDEETAAEVKEEVEIAVKVTGFGCGVVVGISARYGNVS